MSEQQVNELRLYCTLKNLEEQKKSLISALADWVRQMGAFDANGEAADTLTWESVEALRRAGYTGELS